MIVPMTVVTTMLRITSPPQSSARQRRCRAFSSSVTLDVACIGRYGQDGMWFSSALKSVVCLLRTTSRRHSSSTTSRTLSRDRRTLLRAALGLGLLFPKFSVAAADDPKIARPQSGDQFVFSFGDRAGQIIKPEDLPLGGPQQLAYPMNPEAKVIRDGSLLNQVALVRLDPAQLSADTREY